MDSKLDLDVQNVATGKAKVYKMNTKKQPITIAVPLNCNKLTCGKCKFNKHRRDADGGQISYLKYCSAFDVDLKNTKGNGDSTYIFIDPIRLPECKAAEIKHAPTERVTLENVRFN